MGRWARNNLTSENLHFEPQCCGGPPKVKRSRWTKRIDVGQWGGGGFNSPMRLFLLRKIEENRCHLTKPAHFHNSAFPVARHGFTNWSISLLIVNWSFLAH
jgi:hypothetical protein